MVSLYERSMPIHLYKLIEIDYPGQSNNPILYKYLIINKLSHKSCWYSIDTYSSTFTLRYRIHVFKFPIYGNILVQ